MSVCNVKLLWAYKLDYSSKLIDWLIDWLIIRVISYLGLRSSEQQHRQSSPRGTPLKFEWNRGGVLLSRKPAPAISLKRCKIGPRLPLMTYTIGSIHAFDWCHNQRPWMTLKGHYTLCLKTCASFGAHHENLNERRLHYQRRRCSAMTLDGVDFLLTLITGLPSPADFGSTPYAKRHGQWRS